MYKWINIKYLSKVQVFDTPQVVNCFKVESDACDKLSDNEPFPV